MFLEYFTILFLSATSALMFLQNRKTAQKLEESSDEVEKQMQFSVLQSKFLKIYLLATFSDWLQGPYVYKLYHDYNYDDSVISKLFLTGFLSSSICSTAVGHFADCYGRKKLCILFCILYAFSCITKAFPNFWILLVGRILGGMATSILFSVFNAWYIHEHIQKLKLPPEWMNITFSRATFFNGLLAIFAGLVSSAAADLLGWGSLAPFMIAIPVLLFCAVLITGIWDENCGTTSESSQTNTFENAISKSFWSIFSSNDRRLLFLGLVQAFYESALYTFVIAWSPMLIPLETSLGLVFSAFMLCIMLGSAFYSYMVTSAQYSPEKLLCISMRIGVTAMIVVALLTTFSPSELTAQCCYLAFLLFEFSVGMYFPAWGYLSGRTVPEELRASVTSWFRFPMNILTCFSLHWTSGNSHNHKIVSDPGSIYHSSFMMCVALLLVACWSSQRFLHFYQQKLHDLCSISA